jgi:hypothetical protein
VDVATLADRGYSFTGPDDADTIWVDSTALVNPEPRNTNNITVVKNRAHMTPKSPASSPPSECDIRFSSVESGSYSITNISDGESQQQKKTPVLGGWLWWMGI